MKYFDNASTTKISKTSLDSYVRASECFFNPSSLYAESVTAKNMIVESRNNQKRSFYYDKKASNQ